MRANLTASTPLWPLALLAGLLPLLGTMAALALSIGAGSVPACNPFVEGCISISRAAREGLANHVFRATMLPAATLQALMWLAAARWLRGGLPPSRDLALLPWLGVAAAIALVLYATFLGTEGDTYRFLRRWGTIVYFGGTCLCLMLLGHAVQRWSDGGGLVLPTWQRRAPVALAVLLAGLGLANTVVAVAIGGAAKDVVENITEWWGAACFVAGCLVLAAIWRTAGVGLRLGGGQDGNAENPR